MPAISFVTQVKKKTKWGKQWDIHPHANVGFVFGGAGILKHKLAIYDLLP